MMSPRDLRAAMHPPSIYDIYSVLPGPPRHLEGAEDRAEGLGVGAELELVQHGQC